MIFQINVNCKKDLFRLVNINNVGLKQSAVSRNELMITFVLKYTSNIGSGSLLYHYLIRVKRSELQDRIYLGLGKDPTVLETELLTINDLYANHYDQGIDEPNNYYLHG